MIKKKFNQNNCLHAAIKEIRRGLAFQPAIQWLIEESDDEALRAGDIDGNTPLHLAVKYEHFAGVDDQKLLVKKLVEKCRGALNLTNKGKELAPFLYLQECRKGFKGKNLTDSKQVEQKATEPKSMANPGSQNKSPPTPASSTPSPLTNKGPDRVNSAGTEPNTKATRAPERLEHRRKKSKKVELSDDQVVLIFREIEKFLKKYILQNFSHSLAQRILYGPLSGMFQWPMSEYQVLFAKLMD